MSEHNRERAERARRAANELGDMLYEKQVAYGDSGSIALGVWQARLAQYLEADGAHYRIPAALIAHIPRLTRVDDRINRIVSNPDGDAMGEDPWRDMAGDAIIGCIMPRAQPQPEHGPEDGPWPCGHEHPVFGVCERDSGHVEAGHPEHRRVHAGGVMRWYNENDKERRWDPTQPALLGSENRAALAAEVRGRLNGDTYTHGYTPEDDE
jgi:hypothetical protein